MTSHGRCEAPRRGARDRRASAGAAADASRRQVRVGAVPHRVGVRRGGRRTYRGPTACRVMRVHFGDRRAEMHHEHSDTPGDIARSPEVHNETTLSPRPTMSLYPAGSDDDPLSAGELGGPAGAVPAGHRSALAGAG